jgi:hypothetical protein
MNSQTDEHTDRYQNTDLKKTDRQADMSKIYSCMAISRNLLLNRNASDVLYLSPPPPIPPALLNIQILTVTEHF